MTGCAMKGLALVKLGRARVWLWAFGASLAFVVAPYARANGPHGASAEVAAVTEEPRSTATPTVVGSPVRAGEDPLGGIALRSSSDRIADLVVIVSIDGLRPDALGPGTPTMNMLQRTGVSAVHAWTIDLSTTLPSHASMVSGVDTDLHHITINSNRDEAGIIAYPTIFRIARGAGLETSMFVGKRKLQRLIDEGGAERFEFGGVFCENVARRVVAYLPGARRGVVFVHFADVDRAGHLRGWMSRVYHEAVVHADQCTGDIVRALRERGSLDRTLLIVTSDHGGHGRSHGTRLEVDRRIPWIAWGGAASRPGLRFTRPVHTMDTAATALDALGLPHARGMTGRPIREALRHPREATDGATTERHARAGTRGAPRVAAPARTPAPDPAQ